MLSRRVFLSGATAASAARVWGANERVRLGVIGTGGRGSHLMRVANKVGGIEWVAVCDAWDQRRRAGAALAGGKVEQYADYRRLLERRDIDGVIVATLDHLHAPMTVDACRAGKDVFVEKPMTSLPEEGRAIVQAARETGRVVQVGMQQRSMAHFIEARERFFSSGAIGKVHTVRTVWNGNRGYLTPVPPGMERKPEGLDWDACQGRLPRIPWDPKRYFNRFAYWDYATGGQTGGLFVHWVDVAHWYLDLTAPLSAVALGGIYQYNDGRDTPDNISAVVDYPGGLNISFEASLTDNTGSDVMDIVFIGRGGRLSITRAGYHFVPTKGSGGEEVRAPGTPETPHMANWLESIRTRKEPNAGPVAGHYSAMACHMVNMAYKSKSRVVWRKEWEV